MLPDEVSKEDVAHLVRDKYAGDATGRETDVAADIERLAAGEPLAYVIGWIPFLGLRIHLDSYPLIPRPETEWWTMELISHLREFFGDTPFTLLDLCAGSGAIGLSILKAFPQAQVAFGELISEHVETIKKNLTENGLDATRADIRQSDLFETFDSSIFDIIATNPPYIPETRTLPESVSSFEPVNALFAGNDGLSLITNIAAQAVDHIASAGELWMECDISNIDAAKDLLETHAAGLVEIRNDQYGRPRLCVGYYP